MPLAARAAAILRSLHWGRGLRAGFAVATAMVVCRMIGRPMGWAALGGFEAVLVDNGGPYRSRLYTIVSVLVGGALCGIIGTLVPPDFLIAVLVTAAVCFAVTYARVASQPIASTAVIILVIYFAGFGATDRTLDAALANALSYILGGLWAAVLSLFLWPLDPFRPARIEVAGCYDLLAAFSAGLHAPAPQPDHTGLDADHAHATDFKRQLRAKLESARAALSDTPARAPSRTIRARSLSVLLETADLLFALIFRLNEFVEITPAGAADADTIRDIAAWLSGAEAAIANALRPPARPHRLLQAHGLAPHPVHRPPRRAARIAGPHPRPPRRPSRRLSPLRPARSPAKFRDRLRSRPRRLDWRRGPPRPPRRTASPNLRCPIPAASPHGWDGKRSLISRMARRPRPELVPPLRHDAPRLAHRCGRRRRCRAHSRVPHLPRLLARHDLHHRAPALQLWHRPQGPAARRRHRRRWLPRGAARSHHPHRHRHRPRHHRLLHPHPRALCHRLRLVQLLPRPTFVLLSLPYLRDWRFASVRILTTLVGALVSVIAMRVLWPQSLRVELGRLLARSASATATYLHAVLEWWSTPAPA